MPPTTDVEAAVKLVMAKFDENMSEDEDRSRAHAFWDFYVIGGRWAGRKLIAKYDPAKLEEFEQWMTAEKLTVSGVQAGKQRLQPASQIPKVDAKWNEMFPSVPPIPCPMFDHSNDQYGRNGDGTLRDDVCALKDVPPSLSCSRFIVATPNYEDKLEASFMLTDEQWNGCNYMKVDWDGKVSTALEMCKENRSAKKVPQGDWLVVTVDYHS